MKGVLGPDEDFARFIHTCEVFIYRFGQMLKQHGVHFYCLRFSIENY